MRLATSCPPLWTNVAVPALIQEGKSGYACIARLVTNNAPLASVNRLRSKSRTEPKRLCPPDWVAEAPGRKKKRSTAAWELLKVRVAPIHKFSTPRLELSAKSTGEFNWPSN